MEDQETTQTRRPRLGRVAALAVAFLVVSAGAAVAAGVFSPSPADVETIIEDGEEVAGAHLPNWRPGLRTEAVWCMYDLSAGAATQVTEFPLGDELTTDVLLAECATGNDVARNQDGVPTSFTLCRGTLNDNAYAERIAADDRFNIIDGDLSGERPGFPVVLGWEADCASTTLETNPGIVLAPLDSLHAINKAREIEIGAKADSIESCLSRSDADRLARTAWAELGHEWLLIDYGLDGSAECYGVDIEPEWGVIGVRGIDDGVGDSATPTTLPPLDS